MHLNYQTAESAGKIFCKVIWPAVSNTVAGLDYRRMHVILVASVLR